MKSEISFESLQKTTLSAVDKLVANPTQKSVDKQYVDDAIINWFATELNDGLATNTISNGLATTTFKRRISDGRYQRRISDNTS